MIPGNVNQGQHIQRRKTNPWKIVGGILLGFAFLSIGVFIGVGK